MMPSVLTKRTVSVEPDTDEDDHSKGDKRKFNRGASQRRSYSRDEKLAVISMRDGGMSYDEISSKLGYSRVNMEKWSSQKGREAIHAKTSKEKTTSQKATEKGEGISKPSGKGGQEKKSKAQLPLLTGTEPLRRKVSDVEDPPDNKTGKGSYSSVIHSVQAVQPTARGSQPVAVVKAPVSVVRAADHDSGSGSESESDDSSDTCENVKADHVLNLLAKRDCKERQLRRSARATRNHTEAAPIKHNRARNSRASAPAEVTPKDTAPAGNAHPLLTLVKEVDIKREFVRVNHTAMASDITMTISDAMLKMDYFPTSSAGASTAAAFSMSTAVQATRPVLSNTKFFNAVNDFRKRDRAARGITTRSRALEELNQSDDDSDQEKEDLRVLSLLGE